MASEMTPNQSVPAAAGGEPGAAEPIMSAWRANRLWLILSVVAGLATGVPFLLGAFAVRGMGHPIVENVLFINGIALLVGIPCWQIVATWQQSRRLSKLQSRPEFSAE